jgi:hypothetical protein
MSETASPPAEQPIFRERETRPPDQGRSMANALAELQARRSAEVAAAPPPVSQAVAPYGPAAPPQQQAPPELPPPDAVMPGAEPPMAPPASQATQASNDLVVHMNLDGQILAVTVGELQRGYLREIDYTRKTQQAAAQLRQAQEAQQQFLAARQQLEQRLPQYINAYQQEFSQPIDWEKLSREDPIGTGQKVARLLAWQQAMQEEQQLKQLRANEAHAQKMQLAQLGHEVLCKVIPGWADPPTRGVIQQALAQHAVSLGYPAEQIAAAELLDPREIIMAWKSMNFDRLMAQRIQPQPVGVRPLQGNGVYSRQPQAPALADADQRFRQTGKMDDALAVLRARREAEGAPPPPQVPLSRLRP